MLENKIDAGDNNRWLIQEVMLGARGEFLECAI